MKQYITDIRKILEQARRQAYTAINRSMIEAYWKVGKRIVEEEQNGENRAVYGKEVIKNISVELGEGFSERTLRDYRQFYQTFPVWKDLAHACAKLHWSHFRSIMRVSHKEARTYYLKEASAENWSVRTLDRNISSLYYQRLLSSQNKEPVKREMLRMTKEEQQSPKDFIKNPAVLEFLNLPASKSYTEAQLEKGLIDNLQEFLLELGKGFAFVARQKHIRTETQDFYIDLVFYNYILKCFVVIDLKTGKLTHQDIGQLDMYVRMFDDLERKEGDNPTLGVLLCTETDHTVVKYSVLKENKQLFANKYLPYLPTEEELVAEMEREKNALKEQLVKYGK